MKDFDRLVKEAKSRKIHIIMDLVLNHTSDQHPWFIESRKSPNGPYADFYLWRKENPATSHPIIGYRYLAAQVGNLTLVVRIFFTCFQTAARSELAK